MTPEGRFLLTQARRWPWLRKRHSLMRSTRSASAEGVRAVLKAAMPGHGECVGVRGKSPTSAK